MDANIDPQQAVLAKLLHFERQLVQELIEEDALCIMAAGLGWQRVVAVLLRLHHYQKPGVVLIVGCSSWQKQLIREELRRHDRNIALPTEIIAEVQAVERMDLYKSSVCCFVSTRILVVDLLSCRLLPEAVAGFIVVNAHMVTDTSKEGFAVRLLRMKNRTAFLRAFSDHPTYFTAGFNKVEKTMKALQVRKLCLWPRFHKYVQEELPEVEVHEFAVEMSHSMQHVQEAVATVLAALIKELKRTNKVDSCDLNVEDGLHKSFDEAIKRQLDPIWHTVSWKTRQIVKDLKTLRQLALYLMRYDAVTFLGFLEDLRQSEGTRTVWLFHDATHTMYEQARRRVYVLRSVGHSSPSWDGGTNAAGSRSQPLKQEGGGRGNSARGRAAGTVGRAGAAGTAGRAGAAVLAGRGRGRKRGRQAARDEEERRGRGRGVETIELDLSPPRGAQGRADSTPSPAEGPGGSGRAGSPAAGSFVDPVLEEVPKWDLLREVLSEVQRERQQMLETAIQCQTTKHTPHGPSGPQGEAQPEVVDLLSQLPSTQDAGLERERQGQQEGGRQQEREHGEVPTGGVDPGLGDEKQQGRGQAGVAPDNISEMREAGLDEEEKGEKVEAGLAQRLLDAAFAPVLVVAKELHLCQQLEQVVKQGGRAVLQRQYEQYLISKLRKARGRLTWRQQKEAEHMEMLVGSGLKQAEQLALMAEASRLGGQGHSSYSNKRKNSTQPGRGRGQGRSRGRGNAKATKPRRAGDESPTRNVSPEPELKDEPQPESEVIKELEREPEPEPGRGQEKEQGWRRRQGGGQQERGAGERTGVGRRKGSMRGGKCGSDSEDSKHNVQGKALPPDAQAPIPPTAPDAPSRAPASSLPQERDCPLLEGVFFYSLDSNNPFVLWQLQPTFVVLYDPDLAFIRQVEVFKAERAGQPLRVFLLSYEDSLERDAFLSTVERERLSFTQLIDFKQHLVLPADFSLSSVAQAPPCLTADMWLDPYQQNQLTRRAGGRNNPASKAVPRRIIVDMREFNSSLPPVLHQQGFHIIPVTLEVGDYVLSPEIVVERKSIPDLHGSLNSGRLYTQAEAMTRHYKTPVLLIEFDQDKAFTLQSPMELGQDIDSRNILSKLSLLLLHFPRLRLVWSRNLHNTADVFLSLKSNQDEPDAAAAALVGLPLGADGQPVKAPEAVLNTGAVELLRRLPGVNETNWRSIMAAVSCLADLADMPLEKLQVIMGSSKNATSLRTFLDAPCPRQ